MGRKRNPSKKKKKAAEKGTAGNWCECPHATSVAKSLDKSLVPGSLNPGAIDLKQTKKNVGRKGAGSRGVDEDLVLIYSLAMERCDIFPKIVVYKYPDGRLVVVAGVHRLLAVLLIGYTNIPVYFVSVHTAEEQLMFADGTNLEHGLGIGLQERIERATQLVVHGLKSKDEAAAWYGIETDPITLKLRVLNFRKFIVDALEIKSFIPDHTCSVLNSFCRNRIVLRALIELSLKRSLKTRDFKLVLRDVRKAGSELDKLAVIRDVIKEVKEKVKRVKKGRQGLQPFELTLSYMRVLLNNIGERKTPDEMFAPVGTPQYADMEEMINDLRARFEPICPTTN